MSYWDNEKALIDRAEDIARGCLRDRVNKNQVHQVLAHLQAHRDVAATARLLDALERSCFAERSRSTRGQLEGLKLHVGQALRGQRDWRQMARLLGWVCRCMEARRRAHVS